MKKIKFLTLESHNHWSLDRTNNLSSGHSAWLFAVAKVHFLHRTINQEGNLHSTSKRRKETSIAKLLFLNSK